MSKLTQIEIPEQTKNGRNVQIDPIELWKAVNKGVLSEIARKSRKSLPFVSDVLKGRRKSKTGVVEKWLAHHEAPGFTEAAQ